MAVEGVKQLPSSLLGLRLGVPAIDPYEGEGANPKDPAVAQLRESAEHWVDGAFQKNDNPS